MKSAFKMIVISYLVVYYLMTSGVLIIHFDVNEIADSLIRAIDRIGEILDKQDAANSDDPTLAEPEKKRPKNDTSGSR
ncbi:MAG: hypothetical protein DWQ05_05165 [Calditrichaeota bacterium]|nr:MAG: hypothetical protein DWQ05_05165 [Calditrichota bacterium]